MILWGQGFKNIFNKHHNLQKEADFSLMYWIGLNDSFQIFTKWLDKLVLLFLLPAAEFAVYYNGTFELPLVGMFLLTFQSVLTFYGAKESENVNYRIDLFRSSALMMSGFIFPLFAWMFWYSGPIVNLLFGSKYEDSSVLFAFTTLFLPVRICSYTVLLQLANKGRIILTGSIIDFIISLSLMILLYPFFKLNGLVLALVISTYLQAGFYLLNISKTYNVSIGKLLDFPALFLKIVFSVVFIGGVYYLGSLFLAPFYSLVAGGIVLCFFFLYHLMKLYPKISTGHLPARRQGK
jgi:O-antigen/teichoic acid export membrane protein